jgi:hypothetical protein
MHISDDCQALQLSFSADHHWHVIFDAETEDELLVSSLCIGGNFLMDEISLSSVSLGCGDHLILSLLSTKTKYCNSKHNFGLNLGCNPVFVYRKKEKRGWILLRFEAISGLSPTITFRELSRTDRQLLTADRPIESLLDF